jgi:hypothetical protein
VPSK